MSSVSALGASSTPTVTSKDGTTYSTGVDRTAMDTNTFLKLLVAQLQYQDPSNPADTTAFMSQTAQFTAVEKTTQLNELTQKVLDAQVNQTGTSLVGRTVSYTDLSGQEQSGLVTGCTLGSTTPNLTIDGVQILLSAVTGVSSGATTGSDSGAGTGSGSGSGSGSSSGSGSESA